MTATSTWTTNLDNRPVLSERVQVRCTGQELYSNLNLFPYVGQPGWVIETPEYSPHPYNKNVTVITDWMLVPEQMQPGLMFRLLEADQGLYRARWLYAGGQDDSGWLYPDSMTNGDVLTWDHSMLAGLFDVDSWEAQYLSLKGVWYPFLYKQVPHWHAHLCQRIRAL